MTIAEKRAEGMYLRDIAAALGVHPRTVRRAVQRGGPPAPRRAGRRRSKLDAYRAQIDAWLQREVWNAVVIFRELQAAGYAGEISIVRDNIRPKRPLRRRRQTVRFETAPGQQLQGDWGELWTTIAGERTKVYLAVNTLGYSRRFHAWAAPTNDAAHTYESLIRAFEHFGGVPAEVLVDNQKTAVLAHRAGERVRFHPRFLDLAGHYGFRPRACRPYRAQTKGKDERMIGYVKHHFFVRYAEFASWAHLNQLLADWLATEADERVQGTVKEIVRQRFAREAPHLRPLPAVRFDTAYQLRRLVAWDGYVDVAGTRYSVPAALAGQPVQVRLTLDGQLSVWAGEQCVAEHRQAPAGAGWQTIPAHHAALWAETLRVERRDLGVYAEVAGCN